MSTDLDSFLNPESIAIVGASPNEESINGRILLFLKKHNYQGMIYPVNPKYEDINGVKCYPDIQSIPGKVDLVLFAVPAKLIPKMIDECIQQEIPYAIIYSSGFAESGEKGEQLQRYLSQVTKEGKIRVLGPNCQGIFNVENNVAASFSGALDYSPIQSGPIGFVSQSGAMGYSMFNLLQEAGIGFKYVVSTGNEADLEVVDFLDYFMEDDQVKMGVAYVEGFKKPDRLYHLAEKSLQKEKPLIIYKVGNSDIGAKAASSHTAALAGSSDLYNQLFDQLGMITVSDVEEISDLCQIVNVTKRTNGNRIGIVTTSGGVGVSLADQCSEFGLQLPSLHAETKNILRKHLPDFGSDLNPVDLTAQISSQRDIFNQSIKAVANDPNIDILLVALTMVTGARAVSMSENLIELSKELDKPIFVIWMVGDQLAESGIDNLREAQIPCFKSPHRCARTLRHFVDISQIFKNKGETLKFISEKIDVNQAEIDTPKSTLNEFEAKKWLKELGFPVTRENMVHSSDEAVEAARKIGFPVAMKIQSKKLHHKTDFGGVKLHLQSEKEVISAFYTLFESVDRIPGLDRSDVEGILVQEMVTGGQEVIVGCSQDDQLGVSVLFGLGGIFVEALKDTQVAIPPISKEQALKMIQGIRSYPLLTGIRGQQPVNINALAEFISDFSRLSASLEGDIQIDLNPVIVTEEGVKIVDALVIVKEKTEELLRK